MRKQPVGAAFVALPTEVAHALIAACRAHGMVVERIHGKFLLHQDLTTSEVQSLIEAATRTHLIAEIAADYLKI